VQPTFTDTELIPAPEPIVYWARLLDSVANDPRAVATIFAAFFGFLFGVLVKYGLDRRRDDRLHDQENTAFAIAFRAELGTLLQEVKVRLSTIDRHAPTKSIHMVNLDIPAKIVYANNTHRLGALGGKVAAQVIHAHASADHIRQIVAAALAHLSETDLSPKYGTAIRNNFLTLTRHVERAHNALDLFLGDPKRYPVLTVLPAEPDPAGAAAEPAEPDPKPDPKPDPEPAP
jgi:hypothetical protein